MVKLGFDLRLQQLESNIARAMTLINSYEIELIDEDDPGRKSKYNRRIENLRETIATYQSEYLELQPEAEVVSSTRIQEVSVQLQLLNTQINALGDLVLRSYKDLRRVLLARYASGERVIVAKVTEHFNQNQLVKLDSILDAAEANCIPEVEIQKIIVDVQRAVKALESKKVALPNGSQEIVEILNAPAVDFRHKLKVSLPIIPFLLDYEGELELGTGFNLKAAWERWGMKSRGK